MSEPPVSNSPGDRAGKPAVTRRTLFAIGGGAIVGAGIAGGAVAVADRVGAKVAAAAAPPAVVPAKVRRYVSTMLTTPVTSYWKSAGATTAEGLIFATPQSTSFDGVIMDNTGEPVWIEPNGVSVTDLRVQQYQGNPVLTYWLGNFIDGHGTGHGVIRDASYKTIATVYGGKGMLSDLHEFNLTTRGTALVTSYPIIPAKLGSYGGPANGWILDCHVQEIDVATGAILFDWSAHDHIGLGESYEPFTGPTDTGKTPELAWDPYHLNAVADDGNNILVSSRHAHTIYSVDLATSNIRWRLGGKKNDFAIDKDATFAWQHHVRRLPDGRISLFDNAFKAGGTHSQGLILNVDETAKTARLSASYTYHNHLGHAEGSVQLLPNGHVLVGWGQDPFATEFTNSGTAIWEARGLAGGSYRVFRYPWKAQPQHDPDVASQLVSGSRMAYASWNGSTEVSHWRFLAGSSIATLSPVTVVARAGFETSAPIPSASTAVGAEALDAGGMVLGRATATIV